MPKADYYETLGVDKNDSEEQIRRAFRKKAMDYHPDRNKKPGAEDIFKEINEAYQVLSDPQKRSQYDRFGHAGVAGGGAGDRPFDGFDVFGGFGDIFDSFFGDSTGRRSSQPQRGEDLQQKIVLEFEEAVFGVDKTLNIDRIEQCHSCNGNGAEPGSRVSSCGACNGNGRVRRTQRSVFGQFSQVTECSNCSGKGSVIESLCKTCRGNGLERRNRTTEVTIPAGIQPGMQIRVTGQGNIGRNNGPSGNLYLEVDVRAHDVFTRQEFDLFYKLDLGMIDAALGTDIEVPTLDGDTENLKIPQGTQPGSEFRVKGKGVPHINSNRRGDLRIIANLEVPKHLTKQQRKLLQELDNSFKDRRKS